MAYIFLDESGDLGFDFTKERTSKNFVITILFAREKRPIEKIVKQVHAGLKKKHKQRGGILHAHREKAVTRRRLLLKLAGKEIAVVAIFLNKKRVYTRLQEEKEVLYNYVVNILLDRIFRKKLIPLDEEITLVASRKETNKFLNINFSAYLARQAQLNHAMRLHIEIKTPHEEKALQAVDFLSWAIFRKYEYGDPSYHQIVKDKIVEENPLFP